MDSSSFQKFVHINVYSCEHNGISLNSEKLDLDLYKKKSWGYNLK